MMESSIDDPRVTGDHSVTIQGADGTVTLVGVVHDHPASVYRARAVTAAREPAVLAVELPPLALPLFEQYAADDRTPPACGGEMSAAIQAAASAKVVGIDGPSGSFCRRLAGSLLEQRASAGTVRDVTRSLGAATKQALQCRAASVLSALTDRRFEAEQPLSYDVGLQDPPKVQATDETTQVNRAGSVLEGFEQPDAMQIRDQTRESHMADALARLSHEGDVVSIVGRYHLESIVNELEATLSPDSPDAQT